MIRKLPHSIILSLLFGLLASCNNSDCTLSNVVRSFYVFVNSETGTTATIGDTLTVTALPADTVLLNRSTKFSKLSLPMGYVQNVDSFRFKFKTKAGVVIDTVCIEHTNTPHFESLDCGVSIFHVVKRVTVSKRKPTKDFPTAIDSIVIINPKVTYEANDHFKVFISTL